MKTRMSWRADRALCHLDKEILGVHDLATVIGKASTWLAIGFFFVVIHFCNSVSAAEIVSRGNKPTYHPISLAGRTNVALGQTVLSKVSESEENSLSQLPLGERQYGGVPFQVDGIIQLSGKWLELGGRNFPKVVSEIGVSNRCERIHLLHGCGYYDGVGIRIAKLVLNYEDDSRQEIFIRYGIEVLDWWKTKEDSVLDKNTEVAWTSSNSMAAKSQATLRLFKTTFQNPKPEQVIRSIDYEATAAMAASFLVGLTTESASGTKQQ